MSLPLPVNDFGTFEGHSVSSLIDRFQPCVPPHILEQFKIGRRWRGVEKWGEFRHAYLDMLKQLAHAFPGNDWDKFRLLQRDIAEESGYSTRFALEGGIYFQHEKIGPSLYTVTSALAFSTHEAAVFFIDRGLFEALLQTVPDITINPNTFHLPFEGFLLVLPPNEYAIHSILAGKSIDFENDTGDAALSFDAYFRSDDKQSVHLSTPFNVADASTWKKNSFLQDLDRFILTVTINTLFAMAARPEYVESGKRLGTHKKSGSEIWAPNIIGRKYAVKRSENPGTHASPRMHWRRGHFRHQPFGPELKQSKVIWIEPMLVNG